MQSNTLGLIFMGFPSIDKDEAVAIEGDKDEVELLLDAMPRKECCNGFPEQAFGALSDLLKPSQARPCLRSCSPLGHSR